MARGGRKDKGEGSRRLEWKVIRISYASIYFWIFLGIIIGAGALGYYYRDRLPDLEAGLRTALKGAMTRLGLMAGETGGGSGDNEGEILEKRFATLSFVDGDVKIQRSSEFNWETARTNAQLATNDRVRTFSGSRAEVHFDDGSVLKIKPNSLIIIGDLTENLRTKVRRSSVRLMVSSIEADIKKSVVEGSEFRLEMPSATAEIDRARVSVEVGETDESSIKVLSGNVSLRAGGKRLSLDDLTQVTIGSSREVSGVSKLLPAPAVLSPDNLDKFYSNDPDRLSVVFSWKPVSGAVGYRLQLDQDRRFIGPVLDEGKIRSTSYKVSGLTPGVHYIRVGALESGGATGFFSEPVAFMVVLDERPPEVEVQKFVSLKAAGGYDIFMEGSTDPTARVAVDGRKVVVDESGRFSVSISGISLSRKEVVLTARDRVGNETSIPLRIVSRG
jgi:hypothetical protein